MKMVHQPLDKEFNPEYKIGVDRALSIIGLFSDLLEKEGYTLDVKQNTIYYRNGTTEGAFNW